jgi:hypothetical protein
MSHGCNVVLGVVERKVADLQKGKSKLQRANSISYQTNTLVVRLARSSRFRISFAMLMPVCLFSSLRKPISAALSDKRPLDWSHEIQWAVNAKYDSRFELDQESAVKLTRPQDFYGRKS